MAVHAREKAMMSSVPNIGFDKLFLSGWQTQMRSAARDLQSPAATEDASKTASSDTAATAAPTASSASSTSTELSLDQQRQLSELLATDRKVRAHEQAHLVVGRDLILSGPTYSYETGPDGKHYAVAGEVQIDTSPANSPEDTIPKAHHIRATALAPADPSPQDHHVASVATQLEMKARIEIAQQDSAAGGKAVEVAAESSPQTVPRSAPAIQAYQSAAAESRSSGFSTSA